MRVYLVQYHDEHGGLQTQSVHVEPQAAQDAVPDHMASWGMVSDAFFSIEIWDTETGYVDDLKIEL